MDYKSQKKINRLKKPNRSIPKENSLQYPINVEKKSSSKIQKRDKFFLSKSATNFLGSLPSLNDTWFKYPSQWIKSSWKELRKKCLVTHFELVDFMEMNKWKDGNGYRVFLYLYRIVLTSKTFKLKLILIDFFIHQNVFENVHSGFFAYTTSHKICTEIFNWLNPLRV